MKFKPWLSYSIITKIITELNHGDRDSLSLGCKIYLSLRNLIEWFIELFDYVSNATIQKQFFLFFTALKQVICDT